MAGSDAAPGRGEFSITPEEDRFLRAYFHRHAGRYLMGVAGVAVALFAALLLATRASAPDPGAAPEAAVPVADAGLRGEIEQLAGELAELRRRLESRSDDAPKRIAALEKRVVGALERLERVEGRPPPLPSRAPTPAGAAAGETGDAATLSGRLYNLETRQEQSEAEQARVAKDLLERMFQLEQRRDETTRHRVAVEQSVLERLDSLEKRSFNLERLVTEASDSAPAAPAR